MNGCFFGVMTWGCTASSWLAKLLNSHPQVFCCHGISKDVLWSASPPRSRVKADDIQIGLAYCEWLAKHLKFYPAVGNVHGVTVDLWRSLSHLPTFADANISLRAAVVVRHPIVRVDSSWCLDREERSRRLQKERFLVKYEKARNLAEQAGFSFAANDFDRLSFFWYCEAASNRIIDEMKTGYPIFKMEDLVTRKSRAQQFIEHLSSEQLQFSSTVLEEVYTHPINSHRPTGSSCDPAQVFAGWPTWKKEVFSTMLAEKSKHAYEELGYEFPAMGEWIQTKPAMTRKPSSLWNRTTATIRQMMAWQ